MLKNRKFLVSSIFVLMVLALGFIAINQRLSKFNLSSQTKVEPVIELDELSDEQYLKVRDTFLVIVNNQDPKTALVELRRLVKTDNTLLRSCHSLVHEIGHEAYDKYGDFGEAMKYQDEICNSGYLHGVIESHFSESPDVFAAMKTVCNQYSLGSFLSWECYHGSGHGAMYYTYNDLVRSLAMCDSYESVFASSNCANGVFMENFNTDQKLHPSKFLREDDPFYPCAEQATHHKADCYLYAPTYFLSLNKNDYVGALSWCKGAEDFYDVICVGGVGSQAIKENINNPKFVEGVCMSGESSQIISCVKGMVGLYINYYGSLEPAKELCEQLEVSNKQVCYDVVRASSSLFES